MTIGFDARAATHPQSGGFKTYVKNLVLGLSAVDHHNEYHVYVDRSASEALPHLSERFRLEVVSPRPGVIGPVWREQVRLPSRALTQPVDLIHLPIGTAPVWHPSPKIITLHDAIEQMPALTSGGSGRNVGIKRQLMRAYNRYCQRLAARTATVVVTVSECSRRDIIQYLGVPEHKIRVVHEAPAAQFFPHRVRNAEPDRDPCIMAIGSTDPRKNLATLIRAYAALPPEVIARTRLVLAWTHRLLEGDLLRLARKVGVAERITSVPAPNDDALCSLYNAATVFVFPSLYEGFGLPPIEAMACGTPVIASNTSSLPEVLGDAALFVEPTTPRTLTRALLSVLSEPGLQIDLSARGVARAKQFSWRETATRTLSIYEEVVATVPPGQPLVAKSA